MFVMHCDDEICVWLHIAYLHISFNAMKEYDTCFVLIKWFCVVFHTRTHIHNEHIQTHKEFNHTHIFHNAALTKKTKTFVPNLQ